MAPPTTASASHTRRAHRHGRGHAGGDEAETRADEPRAPRRRVHERGRDERGPSCTAAGAAPSAQLPTWRSKLRVRSTTSADTGGEESAPTARAEPRCGGSGRPWQRPARQLVRPTPRGSRELRGRCEPGERGRKLARGSARRSSPVYRGSRRLSSVSAVSRRLLVMRCTPPAAARPLRGHARDPWSTRPATPVRWPSRASASGRAKAEQDRIPGACSRPV